MLKVSVLIATYNMKQYVCEAIESCFVSLPNVEVVVVDDGSSDGTYDVLKSAYGDNHSVLLRRFDENRGKVYAFNAAYEDSTGDLVTLLGADDHMLPGRANAAKIITDPSKFRLVAGNYLVADEHMNITSKKMVRPAGWPKILEANCYPGGAIVISRALADFCFPIKPSLNNEDGLIALVASYHGVDEVVEEDVLVYRRHEANTWGGLDNASAMRKNAKRAEGILHHFLSMYPAMPSKDKKSVETAIKVKSATASWSAVKVIILLPKMIFHRYPLKIVARVAIGAGVYFKFLSLIK